VDAAPEIPSHAEIDGVEVCEGAYNIFQLTYVLKYSHWVITGVDGQDEHWIQQESYEGVQQVMEAHHCQEKNQT
jgi:outer membrane protease